MGGCIFATGVGLDAPNLIQICKIEFKCSSKLAALQKILNFIKYLASFNLAAALLCDL